MIHDPLITGLAQRLVQSATTQRVIAHNLANSETPNFKAFRVAFDRASLAQAQGPDLPLARTNSAHLGGAEALLLFGDPAKIAIARDSASTLRNDGNNVDVDRELADLSANTLYYGALSSLVRQRFAGYRRIISGGRG